MRGVLAAMTASLLLAVAPVRADPPCAAPSLAGLQTLTVLRRSGDYGAGHEALLLGQPTNLLLAPAAKILFATPLGKPIEPDDTGGLIRFSAATAGTYRVATGAPAWIDVVQGNHALASIAHAHGAPCSGIAKMVDFALPAGEYILQFSGTKAASLAVTVSRLP
ncbi:MAG: hypothetical protein JWO65_2050 [Sphingomonas bacterium]|nr:hypothetical protein [Sphingomonas bacterium]